MIVLADYNLNRQAILISGSLVVSGLLDLVPIQLMTFGEVGLPADSNDRAVWRFAQTNGMLLLTANRNAKGEDSLEQVMREESQPTSLEQVMREENQPTSFPIVTIGDPDRVNEFDYRERCVERLVEIAIDIQDYRGAGRLFIP